MPDLIFGGSDVNRMMNGDALGVFEEKTGQTEPKNLANVLPVQMGIHTEVLNAKWYREHANLAENVHLVTNDERTAEDRIDTTYGSLTEFFPKERLTENRRNQIGVRHPDIHYIVGHFDGVVTKWSKKEGRKIISIWEAKHTGEITNWNPPETIVKRNLWQCLLYMTIAEVPTCELSVFYGNRKWQVHNIALKDYKDETILMMYRVSQMHQAVLNGSAPAEWNVDERVPVLLANERKQYTLADIKSTNWYDEWKETERNYVYTLQSEERHKGYKDKLKGLVPDDAYEIHGELLVIKVNRRGAKSIELKEAAYGSEEND